MWNSSLPSPLVCRGAALLVLLLLLVLATPAPAAAADPAPPGPQPAAAGAAAAAPAPPVAFADNWLWRNLYEPLRQCLNSRARLVQFSIVGMAIALFVIMRNRWNKW